MWLSLFACSEPAIPLGVTLADGQIVVGEVRTDDLALEGAWGKVAVPLEDVGMVLPVEGQTLADSHEHVTVWLRNGSELTGRWMEPELEMAFLVGGAMHPIRVPTEKLQALQLRAAEAWPASDNYRVRTTHGDDFLVDPTRTTITVASALGRFGVTLAECVSVGPVGAPTGEWRFELVTGTVLIGSPAEKTLTFALPMGPDTLSVPLTSLVSLTRGSWVENAAPASASVPEATAMPVQGQGGGASVGLDAVDFDRQEGEEGRARAGLSSSGGWFRNDRLEDAKR
jgi:hypothetical protein